MRRPPVLLLLFSLVFEAGERPVGLPNPKTECVITGTHRYDCSQSNCGPAREQLERRDRSVSQTWTFASPLPPGDLSIEVTLPGLTGSAAIDSGVRLRVAGATLYYSHAQWVDARGTRTPVPARATSHGVRLTVPAAVLERSTYPAVLDPVLSPEQTIDPVAVLSPAGDSVRVLGTTAGIFTAFITRRFGANYTRVIGADGGMGPLQGPFDLTSSSPAQLWVIAQTDAGVLVLSQPSLDLVARTFDPQTGAAIGPPRAVWAGRLWVTVVGGQPGQLFVGGIEGFDGGSRPVMLPLSDDGVLRAPFTDMTTTGLPLVLASGPSGTWGAFRSTSDAGAAAYVAQLSASGAPLTPTFDTAAVPAALAVDSARVWVVWGGTTTLGWQWVDDAGISAPSSSIVAPGAVGIASLFATPTGGDVLVGFQPSTALFIAPSVSVARLGVAGLQSNTLAFPGDGGRVDATTMTGQNPPALGLIRRYQERPTSTFTSVHVVQTSPGAARLFDLYSKVNEQVVPQVISAASGSATLLTWSDDRLQPGEVVRHGTLLDLAGAPLGSARSLDQLSWSNGSPTHKRTLASTGQGALAAVSDGFDIWSLQLPLDGGASYTRVALTAGSPLEFEPHISAGPNQYLMTWNRGITSLVGVRVTSTGAPIDGSPVLLQSGTFPTWDTLWDGSAYVVVMAAPPGLQMLRLGPVGSPSLPAPLAVVGGYINKIIAESTGAVGAVGWQEWVPDGGRDVTVLRFALDGGAALGPSATLHLPTLSTFDDLGVWQGAFYAAGTFAVDGGSALWLNELDATGQFVDAAPLVVLVSPDALGSPRGGPTVADGGWLLAYSRTHSELAGAHRVHTRIISADLALGEVCAGNFECRSRQCVDGVCCDTPCGGGDAGDCFACSVASGAANDGTCTPRASGAVCRAAVFVCDVAESCDGIASTCPPDVSLDPDSGCSDVDAGFDAGTDGGDVDGGPDDAGFDDAGTVDAGTVDAGPQTARTYSVGCGCATNPSSSLWWCLLVLAWRKRSL